MGLSGIIDSSVYRGIKDILQRHPFVTQVEYKPDSINKRFLRAYIDPARIGLLDGQQVSTLDVEWRFTTDSQYYRIHYADPNTGFNCGWHCDDDHSELGAVHFQYEDPTTGVTDHERTQFENELPTEILWTALDRLFTEKLSEFAPSR